MKRALLVMVFAASLVMCAAVCALWARSYRVPANRVAGRDVFNITREDPMYWFISNPGRLTLCRQEGRNWDYPLKEQAAFGVRFGGLWGPDGSLLWNLELPYWMLAMVTGLPSVLGMGGWVRRRRRLRMVNRLGLCATCGYDLRGSPGRCPECGAGAVSRGSAPGVTSV